MTSEKSAHFIDVDQLQPGIYIHLDLSWMEHSFPFNSFKIKSSEQIRALKQLKLSRVRYDPEKSDVKPLPKPVISAPQTAPVEKGPLSPAELQALEAKRERVERLKIQREAILQVERELAKAAASVKSINKNIFTKPKDTIEEADQLIRRMIDSILTDHDIAIHAMNDAIGNEEVYFHSLNVSILSLMMARDMGLSREETFVLGMGALFHDIGKTEIPSKILMKTDPLNKSEQAFLQKHVEYGLKIAKDVGLPPATFDVVFQHHEHYDGSGYPRRLKGEEIARLARIVGVANSYDNLCNQTNISNSLTPHEALSLMFSQQRGRYSPAELKVFIHCLGVYPPGTIVKLSNDMMGMVSSINTARPLKPIVLVYDPEIPKDEAILLDMEKESDINISKAMRPGQLPRAAYEYLSPRKRVTYYFDSQNKTPQAKK